VLEDGDGTEDGLAERGERVARNGFVDMDIEALAGGGDIVEGECDPRAANMDWETSEMRTEARFCDLEKVSVFCMSSHLFPTLLPTLPTHDDTG